MSEILAAEILATVAFIVGFIAVVYARETERKLNEFIMLGRYEPEDEEEDAFGKDYTNASIKYIDWELKKLVTVLKENGFIDQDFIYSTRDEQLEQIEKILGERGKREESDG